MSLPLFIGEELRRKSDMSADSGEFLEALRELRITTEQRPRSTQTNQNRPRLGKAVLIIGTKDNLSSATALSRLESLDCYHILRLTNFSEWLISVWPQTLDFTLEEKVTGIKWRRSDIASTLYLGPPAFPGVDPADQGFVFLEYSALLLAVMVLCDRETYRRVSAIYAGKSDEVLEPSEFDALPIDLLEGGSWKEAYFDRDFAAFLDTSGRVSTIQLPDSSLRDKLWLLRSADGSKLLPLVGVLPPWLPTPAGRDPDMISASVFPETSRFPASVRRRECPHPGQPFIACGSRNDKILSDALSIAADLRIDSSLICQEEVCSEEPRDVGGVIDDAHLVLSRTDPSDLLNSKIDDEARAQYFRLLRMLESSRGFVINRPSSGATNFSRVLNLMQLFEIGWSIPESLATNDPNVAAQFIQSRKGVVVYKPCSGVTAIPAIFTNGHTENLDRITRSPVLFQEHIVGGEFRVHALRSTEYAAWIDGSPFKDASRWKFLTGPARIDKLVSRLCRHTCAALNLELAGLDIIEEHNTGSLVALEVNSMPAFTLFGTNHGRQVFSALISAAEAYRAGF